MSFASVEELVEGLQRAVTGLEPGCLSGSDATSLMRLFARARKIAAAGEGLCARRAADCAEWARSGARSAEDWFAREAGTGVRDAERTLDTMERLDGLEETSEAMRRGEISQEQAAEVAAAKDPRRRRNCWTSPASSLCAGCAGSRASGGRPGRTRTPDASGTGATAMCVIGWTARGGETCCSRTPPMWSPVSTG